MTIKEERILLSNTIRNDGPEIVSEKQGQSSQV